MMVMGSVMLVATAASRSAPRASADKEGVLSRSSHVEGLGFLGSGGDGWGDRGEGGRGLGPWDFSSLAARDSSAAAARSASHPSLSGLGGETSKAGTSAASGTLEVRGGVAWAFFGGGGVLSRIIGVIEGGGPPVLAPAPVAPSGGWGVPGAGATGVGGGPSGPVVLAVWGRPAVVGGDEGGRLCSGPVGERGVGSGAGTGKRPRQTGRGMLRRGCVTGCGEA